MAIKSGKESVEKEVKRYFGIAAFKVLAVNPSKEEIAKIRDIQDTSNMTDPVYVSQTEDGNTKLRLTFLCQTDDSARINNGISIIVPLNLRLTSGNYTNKDNTKLQVIDKYGRTAWVTNEEFASKSIPVYKNGPAHICSDYRAAVRGEAELIQFLKAWLNIPDPQRYDNNTQTWIDNANMSDAEISIEHLDKLFKGDVTEISSLINNFLFKAAVGVTAGENGNLYETIYNGYFMKNAATKYQRLEDSIKASIVNNSEFYKNTEFSFKDLAEYMPETKVSETPEVDNPWGGTFNA